MLSFWIMLTVAFQVHGKSFSSSSENDLKIFIKTTSTSISHLTIKNDAKISCKKAENEHCIIVECIDIEVNKKEQKESSSFHFQTTAILPEIAKYFCYNKCLKSYSTKLESHPFSSKHILILHQVFRL